MTARIRYEQAAHFRARRSGLIDPLPDLATCARQLLGAQAQVEAAARWGLALRTAGHPESTTVQRALLDDRTLVRAWGQRDTVHIYHPDDWVLIATAQALWPRSARVGPKAEDHEIADFIAAIERLGRTFTRSDVMDLAPGRLVDAFAKTPINDDPPARMAATRLIWSAGTLGFLSSAEQRGREQAYAARRWWLPGLAWPELTPQAAAIALTRRYLGTWGPASVHDVAHYFGANVSMARTWVAALEGELTTVMLAEPGAEPLPLLALTTDLDDLMAAPPRAEDAWPARLLPAYDTQMMTHANKDFVVPDAALRPRVWGKASLVNPTVLHRGRFVGTWKHKVRAAAVDLELEPLGPGHRVPAATALVDRARFERHMGVNATPAKPPRAKKRASA
jgi:hypothetical protein